MTGGSLGKKFTYQDDCTWTALTWITAVRSNQANTIQGILQGQFGRCEFWWSFRILASLGEEASGKIGNFSRSYFEIERFCKFHDVCALQCGDHTLCELGVCQTQFGLQKCGIRSSHCKAENCVKVRIHRRVLVLLSNEMQSHKIVDYKISNDWEF